MWPSRSCSRDRVQRSVTLDDAGWDAIEGLLGTFLASAAPLGIAGDLAAALGGGCVAPATRSAEPACASLACRPIRSLPSASGSASLALDEGTDLIRVLRPLARAFTGAVSNHGRFSGAGTLDDPWLVGLAGDAGAPSLGRVDRTLRPGCGRLRPAGADRRRSRPGRPAGQGAEAHCARGGRRRRPADPGAADRPTVGSRPASTPWRKRWVGSDGIVIPPPVEVPGLTVHLLPDVLSQAASPTRYVLDDVIGRSATTVVRVSVGDALWLAAAPPDRVLRFDAPSLPPEAFTPPANPATGEWFVVIADRVGAQLAAGDPDGIVGQAARLEPALRALATVDPALAVVATAEAGHAAAKAADAVAKVTDLVTLGTPWSAVTLSVIDVAPAAEALRLLAPRSTRPRRRPRLGSGWRGPGTCWPP